MLVWIYYYYYYYYYYYQFLSIFFLNETFLISREKDDTVTVFDEVSGKSPVLFPVLSQQMSNRTEPTTHTTPLSSRSQRSQQSVSPKRGPFQQSLSTYDNSSQFLFTDTNTPPFRGSRHSSSQTSPSIPSTTITSPSSSLRTSDGSDPYNILVKLVMVSIKSYQRSNLCSLQIRVLSMLRWVVRYGLKVKDIDPQNHFTEYLIQQAKGKKSYLHSPPIFLPHIFAYLVEVIGDYHREEKEIGKGTPPFDLMSVTHLPFGSIYWRGNGELLCGLSPVIEELFPVGSFELSDLQIDLLSKLLDMLPFEFACRHLVTILHHCQKEDVWKVFFFF